MEKDLIKFIQLSIQLMEAVDRCQLCLDKNLPEKQEFEEGNFKRRTPEFHSSGKPKQSAVCALFGFFVTRENSPSNLQRQKNIGFFKLRKKSFQRNGSSCSKDC